MLRRLSCFFTISKCSFESALRKSRMDGAPATISLSFGSLESYMRSGLTSSRTLLSADRSFSYYLRKYENDIYADRKVRLEVNPLRILDSKDPKDKEIVAGAPSILDFLNADSKEHFEIVKKQLKRLNIPFQINPMLVRGLDYYNKTVFEIVAGELGAQNSVAGGGRYDGLIKMLGGPDLPTMGFGAGIERIIQTMIKQQVWLPTPEAPALFIAPLGEEAKDKCFLLLHALRAKGISTQMDFSGK